MTLQENLQRTIVDWFITSWTKQEFPKDLHIKTYEEARKFRQHWYENYQLTLQSAIDIYNEISHNKMA